MKLMLLAILLYVLGILLGGSLMANHYKKKEQNQTIGNLRVHVEESERPYLFLELEKHIETWPSDYVMLKVKMENYDTNRGV